METTQINVIDCIQSAIAETEQSAFWHTQLSRAGSHNRIRFAWFSVWYESLHNAEVGWKIHISAHYRNAEQILKAVIHKILSFKVHFKVAADASFIVFLSEKKLSGQQAGKFITIYPHSSEQAYEIASSLHELTTAFSSSPILTDRPFTKNSIIFYRYGSHAPHYIQTLWGGLKSTMLFNGKMIVDEKNPDSEIYQVLSNPFAKASTASNHADIFEENSNINDHIVHYVCVSKSQHSSVFLCLDKKNKRRCILKKSSLNSTADLLGNSAIERLQGEIKILKKLTGLAVSPCYYEHFFDKDNNLCLVMEDLPGQPLHAYVKQHWHDHKKIPIQDALRISKQLATKLATIHHYGIIHADIKLANIIIDDMQLKLIDFDSACDIENNILICTAGSMGFSTKNRDRSGLPCINDDIYGYGACLYYLFTTIDPDYNPLETEQSHIDITLFNEAVPEFIQTLIQQCLTGHFENFNQIVLCFEQDTVSITCSQQQNVIKKEANNTSSYLDKMRYLTNFFIHHAYDKPTNYFDFSRVIIGNIRMDDMRGLSGALLSLATVAMQDSTDFILFTIYQCALQLANNQPLYNLIPGLYAGESGKAVALLYAAIAHPDINQEIAIKTMQAVNQLTLQSCDLYNGAAGCLRANLFFYKIVKDKAYLAAAHKIVDYLLSTRYAKDQCLGWYNPTVDSTTDNFQLNQDEMLLGYSHGLAGIADALLDYYLITETAEIKTILQQAMHCFLQCAQPILEGEGIAWSSKWNGGLTLPYWCHGGGGIGIFLSRMMAYNLWPTDLGCLEKLIYAIFTCTRGGPIVLCHGSLGSLEALLDFHYHHPTLLIEEKIKLFEQIVANWLRQYCNNHFKTQNVGFDQYGYLTSVAGCLPIYARLQAREIPNPLHLEYASYLTGKDHDDFNLRRYR